jgi:type I restriction enzyme S subunit
LHKSDYITDGVPVINPMHIVDGQLVPTQTMTVRNNSAKRLSEFQLRADDIVIGRRGEMGRCAVVREEQAGWLCGTGSLIIRCTKSVVPNYLQRILSSPAVISAIEEGSVGSTMINLNQGVLGKLAIQFPPFSEQRAIASALSDVDALISSLDRLIAKKRAVKTAAMQQLLTGKRHLSGFSGEWEVKRLGSR